VGLEIFGIRTIKELFISFGIELMVKKEVTALTTSKLTVD